MSRRFGLVGWAILSVAGCGGSAGDAASNASHAAAAGSSGSGGSANVSGGSSGAASGSGGVAGVSSSAGKGGVGGTSSSTGGVGGAGGSVSGAGNGGVAGDGGGAAGAAISGCGITVAPGTISETIASGGMTRKYRVHVPTGYTGATPSMIVFVFHGLLENGAGVETVSQMTPLSDQDGFLVVYPEGVDESWNAGSCCGTAASSKVDDVGFFDVMLAKIESEYCVDPKRVFSAGYSTGAMLSQRLACERADKVAAIGPVAGPIAIPSCTPSRPVGVIEFHGTSDPVVFYGGNSPSGAQPVETTIANWEMYDSCPAPATQVYQMGDATCTEETPCAGGAAVELCKIQGGGHQWPGGMSAGSLLGKTSTDIDASAQMIAFFNAHPMP